MGTDKHFLWVPTRNKANNKWANSTLTLWRWKGINLWHTLASYLETCQSQWVCQMETPMHSTRVNLSQPNNPRTSSSLSLSLQTLHWSSWICARWGRTSWRSGHTSTCSTESSQVGSWWLLGTGITSRQAQLYLERDWHKSIFLNQ